MEKDIIYKIKIDGGKRAEQTIAALNSEIEELEKNLHEAGGNTDRLAAVQRRAAAAARALSQHTGAYAAELTRVRAVQAQAEQGLGQVAGAFNMLRTAAAAFMALEVVGYLNDLARKGLDLAGNYENTTIAFETFLKSAGAAKAVLADLTKFSVETPFTSEEVIQAGKQLLSTGMATSDMMKTIGQWGNVAAGAGANFNELISIVAKFRTQGRLYQEDINQLVERGINLYPELLKVMKLGVGDSEKLKKMIEAGQIGYNQVAMAIENMTKAGGQYAGLIERQSKTLPGLMSTLSGAWDDFLRKVAESSLLEPAKAGVEGLISVIDRLNDSLDPSAKPNLAAVEAMKKELGLENLSALTADELAQRRELINATIEEDRQGLQALEARLRTADERREAGAARLAEKTRQLRNDDNIDAEEKYRLLKEFEASIQAETDKDAIAATISAERAKLGAKELALRDIAALETAAETAKAAARAAEAKDLLKLSIFKREQELAILKAATETAAAAGALRAQAVDWVIKKEKELAALRLQLANMDAKTNAERALNAAESSEGLKEAVFADSEVIGQNLETINEKIQTGLKEARKGYKGLELPAALPRGLEDAAAGVERLTAAQQKAMLAFEKLFGEDGYLEKFATVAPQAFDILGQVFSEQENRLNRLVELQQRRVDDAAAIAEKGNAKQLEQERKRLAALQAEQEKASLRSQRLAQIETRIQIGLAVAKSVAASAGVTLGVGALAVGAAVAVGLPLLIQNLPQFGEGGEVGGQLHSQGGTPLVAERGEFITNRRAAATFMPALRAINTGAADPALVNAAARGDVSNYFAVQMAPVVDRLAALERAIVEKPVPAFLIDENGWATRTSTIQARSSRAARVVG